MTRDEFVKKSLMLGIGFPFLPAAMQSCAETEIRAPNFEINFSGKVLIIGAGAAGLTAGYLLERNNIDFEIIEASGAIGGRMKRSSDFADFPIDLGAEWIHDDPAVLAELLSNPQLDANVDLISYSPKTVKTWNGEKLKRNNWANNYYSEYKFKSTTWFGFFERYMASLITDKIIFNEPVSEINYSTDSISVQTAQNFYTADRILVTVPIKILQQETILFSPSLPSAKINAINQVKMGDGIKAFIKFRERFYPDVLFFGNAIEAILSEDKTYYDAAFRKDSAQHVLGLFAINEKASVYTNLTSDDAIIESVLRELDEIFDGKASANY
ncbi:MAG: FAD-dependent oxidoreductase, partial [Bacteroidota bacterium]